MELFVEIRFGVINLLHTCVRGYNNLAVRNEDTMCDVEVEARSRCVCKLDYELSEKHESFY